MKEITLIKRSNPMCPACNVMQTMLDGEGIEYTMIDITETPEAVDKFDVSSVPVVLIDTESGGTIRFHGVYPIDAIKEVLTDN